MANKKEVTRVYSGKNNKCCCGCSGKYVEKGDKSFEMMKKKVNALFQNARIKDVEVKKTYTSVVVGDRIYILYND